MKHEVENLLSGRPVAAIIPSYDKYDSESARMNVLVCSTDILAPINSRSVGMSMP